MRATTPIVFEDRPIGESDDQMRPLIICIPNQIATSTTSVKSKVAISISSLTKETLSMAIIAYR